MFLIFCSIRSDKQLNTHFYLAQRLKINPYQIILPFVFSSRIQFQWASSLQRHHVPPLLSSPRNLHRGTRCRTRCRLFFGRQCAIPESIRSEVYSLASGVSHHGLPSQLLSILVHHHKLCTWNNDCGDVPEHPRHRESRHTFCFVGHVKKPLSIPHRVYRTYIYNTHVYTHKYVNACIIVSTRCTDWGKYL